MTALTKSQNVLTVLGCIIHSCIVLSRLCLQDQFDNLEKHTQSGIEFVERYTKFVKERSEIEVNYAKQIRNLSKKYQPKKNSREEEDNKYTSCRAFQSTLNELNDYAGQHEVIAENLTSQIITELLRYLTELKAERKSHFHDGRKAQQHIECSWKQLETSKRRFERDCKEADRAQQYFERMDADINVTKADVEKARQQAQMRHQMAADSKSEYSNFLTKFNQEQNEHYYTLIPNIFQKLQEMEERRIERVGVSMKTYAEVDREVLPIVGKCLDGMTKAAESIEPKTDSKQVVESYKTGFEPPGDVEFEDYGPGQSMKRTVSETSLSNSRGEAKERPSGGKSKGKLWPFIKNKNKVTHTHSLTHKYSKVKRRFGGRFCDITSVSLYKNNGQEYALTKMKGVYEKNPQMGDPASVDPRLVEIAMNIEKLQSEVQKFEVSCYSYYVCVCWSLSSPDGSYTEEHSSETQVKVAIANTPEFDDEFDDGDEETLPTIGTCKAIYQFEGHNEGTISVTEGELLYVIEEDKGDGWTRVRRNEEEEGYVPTSYVEVFLETNAKGAMTYI
uniref:Formin binding protein 1 n=1 Tax=Hucho hucho TaxID=62062 RepID=A0A4W5Q0J3_9TELE